jgi:hypothetical protein
MENARLLAINQLSPALKSQAGRTEIAKVTLAREYNVRKWLLEAYLSIVNREAMITVAEREVLGIDVTFELMELRDIYMRVKRTAPDLAEPSTWIEVQGHAVRLVTLEEVRAKFPCETDGEVPILPPARPQELLHEVVPEATKVTPGSASEDADGPVPAPVAPQEAPKRLSAAEKIALLRAKKRAAQSRP